MPLHDDIDVNDDKHHYDDWDSWRMSDLLVWYSWFRLADRLWAVVLFCLPRMQDHNNYSNDHHWDVFDRLVFGL